MTERYWICTHSKQAPPVACSRNSPDPETWFRRMGLRFDSSIKYTDMEDVKSYNENNTLVMKTERNYRIALIL